MCLAIPARVVELEGDRAVADALGNRWRIRTTLTPEVKKGDIVLIHAGFAIARIDEKQAQDVGKAAFATILVDVGTMTLLFATNYCNLRGVVSILWLPIFLFTTLLTFSASNLYLNQKS